MPWYSNIFPNVEHLAGENTTVDLSYSYHMSRYSCIAEWYYIHIFWCYVVFFTGVGSFISRPIPALNWTHVHFGRGYFIAMLFATASSMLVHNDGLPLAVLLSFIHVLVGMGVAFVIIKFHQSKMETAALEEVQLKVDAKEEVGSLADALAQAKGNIARRKTFSDRFFSLKAAHGIIMTLSWFNIAGRIVVTTLHSDFTCHTYPAFKPVNANQFWTKGMQFDNQPLQYLPEEDPNNANNPWERMGLPMWNILNSVVPLAIALVFGWFYSNRQADIDKNITGSDKRESTVALVDVAQGS